MLKCPVCNAKLKQDGDLLYCPNDHCGWVGNEAFWEDFIYITKKLDRAKWWLKEIVENHRYTPISTAEMALKELEE